jgi:Xaa-Pro aminopeptidase
VTKWGALAGGWVEDVRSGHSITENIIETLRDLRLANGAIGVVGFGETRPRVIPETVPYQQFSGITSALSGARFVEAGWLLEQARIIKGSEEIACIRKSAELAKAMADALIASAQPGARETEVYADMLHANLRGGGEEDMIWISSGAVPPPHGKRPPASHRILEAGDIVVCEYHACYKGYLTGAELSVSLGQPRAEYQRIHEVSVETQTNGIAAMKPGNFIEDAVHAFRQPIIDAGFGSVECGFHGHGLASPEFPSCMYGGTAGSWQKHAYARMPAIEFQENMVFATASDIYDPGWNEDTGLMMGRTVVITDTGAEEITGIPLDPEMIVV